MEEEKSDGRLSKRRSQPGQRCNINGGAELSDWKNFTSTHCTGCGDSCSFHSGRFVAPAQKLGRGHFSLEGRLKFPLAQTSPGRY